ncbi:MAG: RagB/SusD family nutrient uptake outer membrane protein [Mucilaginibacter sp.]|nr:RagB/SusD family nutrient uptake outer membrane protein [Mucilaginibacter sp.]
MKIRKYTYTLALLASTVLWSCKKQLNVFPTTQEVDGNVIVDAKSAKTVLNGVYYRFANAGADYNTVPSILWTSVNEIVPSELSGSLSNSSGEDGVYSLTLNSTSYAVSQYWTYGYQLVNAANGFLKNVKDVATIPTASKNQMIAEAKFLRAFGNAQLLLYFGQYYDTNSKYGIILRDEFVTSDNINLPRSTVSESYASILSDLDAAIPDLPKTNTTAYYANQSAAKLLEARVLINRGAAADLPKVISLTTDVITNGGFQLENSLQDLFLTKGFNSTEVILGIQPYPTETYKFQQNQYYGQYPASETFVELLKSDPRNTWLYKDDQGGTVYGGYYGNINEITKYYSGDTGNPKQTPLSENSYAFRLSEAYLLRAEANATAGTDISGAKADLKLIEKASGYTNPAVDAADAATLRTLILKEQVKNFFVENGLDWFAIRRLPLAEAQILQPAFSGKSDTHYIFPIPQTEINLNNKLIPNP